MNCKIIFNTIITTICIFNTNINASANENITNKEFSIINDASFSSDRMDLISQTNENDSGINSHSNNNSLIKDKYIKLPVQKNTNIDNNSNIKNSTKENNKVILLEKNKLNENIINIDNNKNDIILTVNKPKLLTNDSLKNPKENNITNIDNNEIKSNNNINNQININESIGINNNKIKNSDKKNNNSNKKINLNNNNKLNDIKYGQEVKINNNKQIKNNIVVPMNESHVSDNIKYNNLIIGQSFVIIVIVIHQILII